MGDWPIRRLRQAIGVLVHDLPRYAWTLRPQSRASSGPAWIHVRNRRERLIRMNGVRGVACDWEWTSELHAPRVFPWLGRAVLKRALRDFPIRVADSPEPRWVSAATPDVSFIIGHRGPERQPLLLATLRSIAAQEGVSFECVVVEQAPEEGVRASLPGWVRYVRSPLEPPQLGYSRSAAFNAGARAARGKLFILHDNDMLVPAAYAAEMASWHREGYEVINLKRLIFYLSREHSLGICEGTAGLAQHPPESVVQNLEAGGSLGVDAAAYGALGGFDEGFVGWGGEDNEFWERAMTRKLCPFGYLPIVHLWHPVQPERLLGPEAAGVRRYRDLRQQPPRERIARLHANAAPRR